jgi:hypothetical protein
MQIGLLGSTEHPRSNLYPLNIRPPAKVAAKEIPPPAIPIMVEPKLKVFFL